MSRTAACLALLLTASAAAAQQRQPDEPIRLTLHPAALPVPGAKYRLLPPYRDQVPGNAAALYYRAMGMFGDKSGLYPELKSGQWELWLNMPLRELPLSDVANKLEMVEPLLREFDEAARRRDCDWQLADRPEGLALLLPEVQGLREMARILAVRARYHIAGGRYAEAVRALRAGYALGWNLCRQSPAIHVLVGVAITYVMDNVLEELLSQPGAPNLYWALALLPRPYCSLGVTLDQQATLLERTWPDLKRLDEGPMTAEQVRQLRREISSFFRRVGYVDPSPLDELAQLGRQAAALPGARKALLAEGLTAEQLDAMPPFQVIALDAMHEYRRAWDEYVKWVGVDHFGRQPGYETDRERLRQAAERLERLVLYARPLPPGQGFLGESLLDKVHTAAARAGRRFACERCLEALRLYAADHGGHLPAALKDVTEVPVPADPLTGLPFVYEAHGDRAKLVSPLRDGEKPLPYSHLVYEITLAH